MPSRAAHDFLLEASELISRASIVDSGNDGWPEEETQSSRFIHPVRFRQRAGLEGTLLTRTYNGRPHIPGEDSGSDTDDERTIPYSRTNRDLSPPSESTLADLPSLPVSSSIANRQQRSTDDRANRPPQSRLRLQDYVNEQARRGDDGLLAARSRDQDGSVSVPSSGISTSRTPIRARRAPPRPHFPHTMEETINRAAVFERRLDRALREYRTARRAWTTLSNPHANPVENETHARTITPASITVQATTTSTENDRTERNSVHDILRSVRREQPSSERLTTSSAFTQEEIGWPLNSSNPTDSNQRDTPRRRQEPEDHSQNGNSGPNAWSSTNLPPLYARLLGELRPNRTLTNTNRPSSISSNSGLNRQNFVGGGQSDRLLRPVQRTGYGFSSPFLNGLYLEGPRDPRLEDEFELLHHRPTTTRASALSGPESSDASQQRRSLHDARSIRNRSDRRNIQSRPLAVLEFLARLRGEDSLTREDALDLATRIGVHNQNLERDSQTTDLVMSLDELPDVGYTSWLEPGVSWTGVQYADSRIGDSRAPTTMIQDQLRVKVVLHSVDWDKMTLTGTMAANQSQSQRKKGTESFFTGEIIDFRQHGLDTYCTRRPKRYTSFNSIHSSESSQWGPSGAYQDLEMDLLHWPMIGPFKRDIDRALSVYQGKNQQDMYRRDSDVMTHRASQDTDAQHDTDELADRHEEPHFKSSPDPERESPARTGLTADELASITLNKISDQLSSTQWLRSNLNQAGWILMRWKEQCFMPSIRDQTCEAGIYQASHDIESPDDMRLMSQRVWTTVQSERESLNSTSMMMTMAPRESTEEATTRNSAYGLSIDGFYYVALNRQTGEIEALYHDPGSVLYQKLEMKPSTSLGHSGVRSNFGLVEFR